MKTDLHEEMVREIISGEDLAEFRQASLAKGLGALRRRRRIRTVRRVGGWVATVCGLGLAGHFLLFPEAIPRRSTTIAGKATAQAASAPSAVKIISDEELLAFFPGRAVALIGPRGRQQFVFLDRQAQRSVTE
jgi:hypothetical protein